MADEYDRPEDAGAEPSPVRLGAGASVTLPALLHPDELEERTGFRMPRGPYETLAGLVLARLGRLAETGDTVTVDGWTLTVTFVQRRRIEAVTLTAPTAGEQQR